MANCRFLILIAALLIAPFSFAQTPWSVLSKDGVFLTGSPEAVALEAQRTAAGVGANGTRATVPYKATATVPKAALAKAAGRLFAGASVIGTAYLAYDVYNFAKNSGISTCPPPAFFCKPSTEKSIPWTGTPATSAMIDPNIRKDASPLAVQNANGTWTHYYAVPSAAHGCGAYPAGYTWTYGYYEPKNIPGSGVTNCAFFVYGARPADTLAPPPGPAMASTELADAIAAQSGWPSTKTVELYNAIRNDMARQPGQITEADVVPLTSPMTVSGSPVTTPEVTTSTKVTPNADGSTSTETQKQRTTFTPALEGGSTVADGKVVIKESTVTTTTVTNNITNNTTTTTQTDSPQTPAEEQKDLCAKNPDALACQKLGDVPKAEEIPNENKQITLSQDSGWGASDAACPAPRIMVLQGKQIPFEFDLYCKFASGVRPLFIGFAWLAAGLMLIGVTRKE